MNHVAVLTKAFRALTEVRLGRLALHAKAETPICCGPRASLYADRDGAG